MPLQPRCSTHLLNAVKSFRVADDEQRASSLKAPARGAGSPLGGALQEEHKRATGTREHTQVASALPNASKSSLMMTRHAPDASHEKQL